MAIEVEAASGLKVRMGRPRVAPPAPTLECGECGLIGWIDAGGREFSGEEAREAFAVAGWSRSGLCGVCSGRTLP